MARHSIVPTRIPVATAIALATIAFYAQFTKGQTAYEFVNSTNGVSVNWHDSANWDPSGIPNMAGDSATFTRPTVSPSDGFSILLDQDTTVGSITVDSTGYTDPHNFTIDGNPITFQTTSGPASYTETEGGGGNERVTVWNNFTVLSDLVMTFDHRSELNSSSLFNGLITGTSDRTITKEGLANLQLSNHGASGFAGQYVINNGGIRFTASSNLSQSAGVTVNAGGQLQFNAAEGSPVYDWNLANGAVLNLNGLGKDDGSAAAGALRFQGAAPMGVPQNPTHASFHNTVVLQSDTRIAVGPGTVTAELTNVVSGDGGLIKSAPGILLLCNPGNSYAGDTTLEGSGGTLSIASPFLSDDADVYLATEATLNLNYSDTDLISALFIDGIQQEPGLWGAMDNAGADFTTELITGNGLLEVTASLGVPGDYNGDGLVDAADYVVWRDSVGAVGVPAGTGADGDGDTNVTQADYDFWSQRFGGSAGSGAMAANVPEPASIILTLCGLWAAVALRATRRG